MKNGTIVRVPGHSRPWVALNVSRFMIRRGINARKPGLHFFGGAWYGNDLQSHKSFGKVIPGTAPRKVIGSVTMRRTLRDDLVHTRANRLYRRRNQKELASYC